MTIRTSGAKQLHITAPTTTLTSFGKARLKLGFVRTYRVRSPPHSIEKESVRRCVVGAHVIRHARRRQKYFENSLMKRAVLRVAVVDEFTSRRRSARGSLGLEAGAGRRKEYGGRGRCGSTTCLQTLDGQYKSTNIFCDCASEKSVRVNMQSLPPVR
jgi:hypothetical protein